jgi:pimeloyl-ACP methyl ester carboxylesterase
VERVGDDGVFVVDTQSVRTGAAPPLLVLHGYPTSSIDFAAVVGALAAERRVVLLDYPGFGLSTKPDRAYSLFGYADAVEAVVASLGLDEVDLLTHDIGDSVGGELLARSIDGTLGFGVRRRVLTNGSIYMHLVQLSEGQQLLESLPDEAIAEDAAPDVDAVERALLGTLAPPGGAASRPDPMHVRAAAVLVVHEGGNRLLARTIRYIAERREHESRWTGAIEQHPAPLAIVWGDVDPIAVYAMTDELLGKRPDATRTRLEGVGHYPMVEAPAAFSAAVLEALG